MVIPFSLSNELHLEDDPEDGVEGGSEDLNSITVSVAQPVPWFTKPTYSQHLGLLPGHSACKVEPRREEAPLLNLVFGLVLAAAMRK